jgi:hypothetical protein
MERRYHNNEDTECFQFPGGAEALAISLLNALQSNKNTVRGLWPISNNTNTTSVTFSPALSFQPTLVVCNVIQPVGGSQIWPNPVAGTLTQSGFTVTLSGITDSAGYLLSYIVY